MKPIVRLLIVLALPWIVLMVPALAVADSTITACVSGPPACDYASIQAAIDASGFGDTIIVGAGTYTEQLTLKSGLTITSTDGPTSTIVTALASPIISGSQIISVAVSGLGIQGNSTLTTPVGLDFYSSTLMLSNLVISDLRGATGTAIYTDGADAIGLRLTGQSDLRLTDSSLQNIMAGNGLSGSGAIGGDAFGVWVEGLGTASIMTTTLRQIVGGNAGTLATWPYACKGAGGAASGIRTNGDINLSVTNSTITDLAAGEPCRAYALYCVENAGAISGVEASGGTLSLTDNVLSNFAGWAARHNVGNHTNYAIRATGTQQVSLNHNRIVSLTIYSESMVQRPGAPDSPYCVPQPGSFFGITVADAEDFTATDNSLTNLTGLGMNGGAFGLYVRNTTHAQISGNFMSDFIGGTGWFDGPDQTAIGIIIEEVQSAQVEQNHLQHIRGGTSPYFGYGTDVVNGGGAIALTLYATSAYVKNNLLWDIAGGDGNEVDHGNSQGGDAYAMSMYGTSATLVNNTIYQVTPGASLSVSGTMGSAAGLRLTSDSALLAINNIVVASDVGISNTSSITPLLGYNDLWNNPIDYVGIVSSPLDLHVDPRFKDAAHGDFRLAFSSPLIDRGFTPMSPSDDLDGNPRPIDGNGDGVPVTDIGAYEYQPTPLHRYYLPVILH